MAIPHETTSNTPNAPLWQARVPLEVDKYFKSLALGAGYRQAIVERLLLQLYKKLVKKKVAAGWDPDNESTITKLTE